MINQLNIEKAKQEIRNSESPIIIKAQDNEFNRKILEFGKFQILLLSYKRTKDKLKQLDSNFNHVLAKIATKNKIKIAYDLEEIRKLEKKDKAIFLARIRQNIKICRKAKSEIILLNIKDKKDTFSFLTSIGASSQQAKIAITN